jgi:hypothetical protein
MSSTKKIILAVALSIVALLWFVDEYPCLRFRGDGKFSGGPVFGYYIKMRPIPFSQAGEYIFHFRGIPDEEMSLQLSADGKTDDNRDELIHLSTTLEAILVDQSGQIVCQGSGKPGDGQNERIWVLMSSGFEAAFWHWHCVHLPLKPNISYTLTLRVSNVDAKTPKINLLPVLSGGQLDLP